LAALATACAPPSDPRGAGKPPSSTPLLRDFARYCLDTRVESAPAIAAAKSAGMEVRTYPPSSNRAGVSMTGWLHPTGDTVISTSFAGEETDSKGVVHAMTCQAADPKDNGASVKALDAWLGRGHRLGASGAVHEFQLRDGRVWPIDGDDPKATEASRATGNHYVLAEFHHKTVTTLTLRRWRASA
jgi:hypothetical protein